MSNVHISSHPVRSAESCARTVLIQHAPRPRWDDTLKRRRLFQVLLHKLSHLRDGSLPPREFRRLLHEVTLHLGCVWINRLW